jgi:DNA-binding MarR family transcriptional regulator
MFEQCIYFNLNALVRDLNKIWEAQYAEMGLTPPVGYMFTAVLSEPGLSQKELAKHLHLERSTVTRFLDTLEKKGLIKREESAEDARVVRVYPSEKGKALKAKAAKVMKKVEEALGAKVSGQDIDNLLKTAGKFREKLNG